VTNFTDNLVERVFDGRVMSNLRSSLEVLAGEDLKYLSDAEVDTRLAEITRAEGVLYVERSRTLAEAERRKLFALTGHLSMTSWTQDRLHATWGESARAVTAARSLEHMPAVRDALLDGEISVSDAARLVEARQTAPEDFGAVEDLLVDSARRLDVRSFHRAVAHWRRLAESEDAAKAEMERRDRRGVRLSRTLGGMFRIDGMFDPEGGSVLDAALSAEVSRAARSPGDPRTPAQCRADAIVELARRYLDSSDREVTGGERPHLTVVMDLETLEGRTTAPVELPSGGEISPASARRIACDASVARVITNGRSEPLDVGRRTPVVPASLRRALVIRDGSCRFPGCDRPVSWCDAHHVIHWADGGHTKLRNLVLLCRRHHRSVHEGFRVEMVDGRPRFTRPDGELLEERGPP